MRSIDIPAALQAAGIGVGPTPPDRRLIRTPAAPSVQVVEFFSSRVATRLLAIPRGSANDHAHEVLFRAGMPVLPRYDELGTDALSLLYVPIGTMPLRSRLHLFRRDPAYADLLTIITATQRTQHERGLGVFMPTHDVSLIDHFAFRPDSDTPGGQRLYLVPPYNLDTNSTPEDFATKLFDELRQAPQITEDQLGDLHAAIVLGVTGDGS